MKTDTRSMVLDAVRHPANAPTLAALTDLLVVLHRSRVLRQDGARADSVLLTLVKAGPTRPGDLAAAAGLDQSTVSRHLHQLETSGHVTREPDPADRRAQIVAATAAGIEHSRAVVGTRVQQLEQIVDGWSQNDRDAFARLLARFTTEYGALLDDTSAP